MRRNKARAPGRQRGYAQDGGEAGKGSDLVSTLFFSLPMFVLPLPGPGGTLWSHLLSQARPQYPGLSSGSTQKSKTQCNTHLSVLTPAWHPMGYTVRTSQSLLPSLTPQSEADSEPAARTSTSCSLDLIKAPSVHLQARRAGQSSDPGPPQRLSWVREGASRVLGGCGRHRAQSPPSDRASWGCGGAVWSVKEEQVKQWAAEMLVALEALHEQGVLCRDLNPRNLLLDQAGRSPDHPTLPHPKEGDSQS